eukprot:Pgem_evm1s1376
MGKKGRKGTSRKQRNAFGHLPKNKEVISKRNTHFATVVPKGLRSTQNLLNLINSTRSTANCSLGPYKSSNRILLVGEGNFSFAKMLSISLGPANITATCFDSYSEVCNKYESSESTIKSLRNMGVLVQTSIDATKLKSALQENVHRLSSKPDLKHLKRLQQPLNFDRIVFNFPHIGGSTDDDIVLNQNLLSAFFIQCLDLLT